jgi:hypothetical protein
MVDKPGDMVTWSAPDGGTLTLNDIVVFDAGGLMSNTLIQHVGQLERWGKADEAAAVRRELSRVNISIPSVEVPAIAVRGTGFLCGGCGGERGTGDQCEACGGETKLLHIVDGKIL